MKTIHHDIRHGASKYESKYTKKYESKYAMKPSAGKAGATTKTMFFSAEKNGSKIHAVDFDKIVQKNSVATINERLEKDDTSALPVEIIEKNLDKHITNDFFVKKPVETQTQQVETATVEAPKLKITADLFKKR